LVSSANGFAVKDALCEPLMPARHSTHLGAGSSRVWLSLAVTLLDFRISNRQWPASG
jgi:hypothetical protein